LGAIKVITRYSATFVLVVTFTLLLAGCFHEEPSRLFVAPPTVVPGDELAIHSPAASFVDNTTIEVKFGDVISSAIRVDDSHSIGVAVPVLEPGPVKVVVRDRGDLVGEAEVTIVRHPLRRLRLVLRNGEVTIENAYPYNGEYGQIAKTGRRISYDVLDESGALVYSGAISHPAESTLEVFGDPALEEGIQRVERGESSMQFLVRIPNLEGRTTIRFYEAGPELDLTDPDDRALRELLTEVVIP
jgi:hypothetical protein